MVQMEGRTSHAAWVTRTCLTPKLPHTLPAVTSPVCAPPNQGNGLISKKQFQLDEILSVLEMLIIPPFRKIPAHLTASVRMGPAVPPGSLWGCPNGQCSAHPGSARPDAPSVPLLALSGASPWGSLPGPPLWPLLRAPCLRSAWQGQPCPQCTRPLKALGGGAPPEHVWGPSNPSLRTCLWNSDLLRDSLPRTSVQTVFPGELVFRIFVYLFVL